MKGRISLVWVVLVTLAAVIFGACGASGGSKTGGDAAALEGKTWMLVSYGDPSSPQAVIQDTEVTLEFSAAEEQIGGKAGCNSYFGGYQVKGAKLTISQVGRTEMFCASPAGVMEQENAYLTALQAAESYQVEGGQLRVTYAGGQVLVFDAGE